MMMEAGVGHDGCVQVLLDKGVAQVNYQDKVSGNLPNLYLWCLYPFVTSA